MTPAPRALLALVLPLTVASTLLVACGEPNDSSSTVSAVDRTQSPADSPTASGGGATKSSKPAETVQGSYIGLDAYTAAKAKYADTTTVLFFAASWCPTCREADKNLTAAQDDLPAGLTVVKVDYDSATDLRQKYGVTVQHTFVQVDADGNELAKWVGSYTPEEIQSQVV